MPPSALDHSRHPHLAYQQPQHHVNPHLALALEKRKIEEQRSLNLEAMLMRQSVMAGAAPGAGGGWTGADASASSMADSADFQSMVGGQISMTASEFGASVPFPRITVGLTCAVVVLQQRDDSVHRLGGESTPALAARAMGAKAFNFFSKDFRHPEPHVRDRAGFYQDQVGL